MFARQRVRALPESCLLDQDVLWLEVPVCNVLCVHGLETAEHLPQEVLNVGHRQGRPSLIGLPELVLKAPLAEFHHDVLDQPLLLGHISLDDHMPQ